MSLWMCWTRRWRPSSFASYQSYLAVSSKCRRESQRFGACIPGIDYGQSSMPYHFSLLFVTQTRLVSAELGAAQRP